MLFVWFKFGPVLQCKSESLGKWISGLVGQTRRGPLEYNTAEVPLVRNTILLYYPQLFEYYWLRRFGANKTRKYSIILFYIVIRRGCLSKALNKHRQDRLHLHQRCFLFPENNAFCPPCSIRFKLRYKKCQFLLEHYIMWWVIKIWK